MPRSSNLKGSESKIHLPEHTCDAKTGQVHLRQKSPSSERRLQAAFDDVVERKEPARCRQEARHVRVRRGFLIVPDDGARCCGLLFEALLLTSTPIFNPSFRSTITTATATSSFASEVIQHSANYGHQTRPLSHSMSSDETSSPSSRPVHAPRSSLASTQRLHFTRSTRIAIFSPLRVAPPDRLPAQPRALAV